MTHDEYIEVMRLVDIAIRSASRCTFLRQERGTEQMALHAKEDLHEALRELETFNPDKP